MSSILTSDAFRTLRERINGIDLAQFSMLTRTQYAYLQQILALPAHARVLDVGCGVGKIAASLQSHFACEIIGIDKNEEWLAEGRATFAERVELISGNFDELPWDSPQFDAIYAIDTLYFSADLPALVPRLCALLRPGGKLVVFWTQTLDEKGDLQRLKPENTDLGSALTAHGLTFSTQDFTEEDIQYWEAAHQAIRELASDFRSEDEKQFCEVFSRETDLMRGVARAGRLSRFCYHLSV